ncbi:MAG: hypothetical protein FWD68_04975 [Alphaproteobacteria bacterium]|nr:hypothetical protein [Alphaproteobacteria bacterium]
MHPGPACVRAAGTAEFRVGLTLRQTITALHTGFWPHMSAGMVLASVTLASLSIAINTRGSRLSNSSILLVLLLLLVVNVGTTALVSGAQAHGAFETSCGRDFGLSNAARQAFRRVLPLTFIAFAQFVALSGGAISAFTRLGPRLPEPALVAIALMGVLCAVFFVMTAVAIPVCIIENPGPVASIIRSIRLTTGSFWKVLALLLATLARFAGVVVLLLFLTGYLAVWLRARTLFDLAMVIATAFLITAIQLPTSACWNCLVMMICAALRQSREGMTAHGDIARVFE